LRNRDPRVDFDECVKETQLLNFTLFFRIDARDGIPTSYSRSVNRKVSWDNP